MTTQEQVTLEAELAAIGAPVVLDTDPGFDDARRVWNAAVDCRPRAVLRCRGVDDVAAGLACAVRHGVPVAVRGGGHGFAGHGTCDGGVVLDLGGLQDVVVDPSAGTARVGAGVRWGQLADAASVHGLAPVGGHVTGVGVPGLLLGGGVGWLARRHGLACDNLLAATVVTADGRVVEASADEHPDLFWGLRGGGGNLGVVVSLTLRLHPLATVYGGLLVVRRERARDVLGALRDLNAEGDRELNVLACLTNAPPEPFVPEDLHFRPCVLVGVCWTGDPAVGASRVAQLREAGEPVADLVDELPFAALQHLFDGFNAPTGFHMRAHLIAEPTDDALDTLVDATEDLPPGMSSALLLPLGGAVADVPSSTTAFAHRAAAYNLEVAGAWPPGQDDTTRERAWAEACWSAMGPFAVGVEVNHLADEGPERVRDAYGPDNFARLAALKREWDPDNVLRVNQNVPPA